jgi:hypothetical protein
MELSIMTSSKMANYVAIVLVRVILSDTLDDRWVGGFVRSNSQLELHVVDLISFYSLLAQAQAFKTQERRFHHG